jgi:hypothetical protein
MEGPTMEKVNGTSQGARRFPFHCFLAAEEFRSLSISNKRRMTNQIQKKGGRGEKKEVISVHNNREYQILPPSYFSFFSLFIFNTETFTLQISHSGLPL